MPQDIRILILTSDRKIISRERALNDPFFRLSLDEVLKMQRVALKKTLSTMPYIGKQSQDRFLAFLDELRCCDIENAPHE